jgi:hypothetical protein
MVFNFADDSRNLVFRKGVDSVDYVQDDYYIAFKSMYSNKWLLNRTPPNKFYDGGMFVIKLTKVDDNDTYISFSWDSSNIDGFGTPLPSEYNKEDIDGYYILSLRGANILPSPVYTKEISQHVCKVINDRSTTTSEIYTINKATKEQEEGGEYIYYRE